MWKISLAFTANRFLLLLITFIAVNQRINAPAVGGLFPGLHPVSTLARSMLQRIRSESSEVAKVEQLSTTSVTHIFKETRNPFYWLTHWMVKIFHFGPLASVLLLSNLFFLLFLFEIHATLSRIVTSDIASATPILVLLWPTSLGFSAGSELALVAFLMMLSIRYAMDNQWLGAGIGLGLMALMTPMAFGLVPLLVYLFWYYQRSFPLAFVLRRTAYFIAPCALAILWTYPQIQSVRHIASHSALLNFFESFSHGNTGWTMSKTYLGQTLTAGFFLMGAIIAGINNNTVFMHRLIPLYLFALLMICSPLNGIAARAPMAGICLQGIASISALPVLRTIQLGLMALSVVEIFGMFY